MNKERGKESREEENGRKDGSKNLERGKRSREEEKEKKYYLGDVYNEKNRAGYSPVKRVSRLEGMILIFVYSESLSHFCRDGCITWFCFELNLV